MVPHLEAAPPCRRLLRPEDPRACGHLERPDDAADWRHARWVMATHGTHAWQLNDRNFGELQHVYAVRRSGIYATWALRQCWAAPMTAAARSSWLQDHHTPRWCCCGRDGRRLEEAEVAAMAARGLPVRFTMSTTGCECVLHTSFCCAGLSGP